MNSEEKKILYNEASKHIGINIAEWLGAMLRYGCSFGKRDFKTLYNAEEFVKNAWIGTVFQILMFVLFFALLFIIF